MLQRPRRTTSSSLSIVGDFTTSDDLSFNTCGGFTKATKHLFCTVWSRHRVNVTNIQVNRAEMLRWTCFLVGHFGFVAFWQLRRSPDYTISPLALPASGTSANYCKLLSVLAVIPNVTETPEFLHCPPSHDHDVYIFDQLWSFFRVILRKTHWLTDRHTETTAIPSHFIYRNRIGLASHWPCGTYISHKSAYDLGHRQGNKHPTNAAFGVFVIFSIHNIV